MSNRPITLEFSRDQDKNQNILDIFFYAEYSLDYIMEVFEKILKKIGFEHEINVVKCKGMIFEDVIIEHTSKQGTKHY